MAGPLAKNIQTAAARLQRCYGIPAPRKPRPLLDILIETILSQNTSDVNSRRAFLSLKRAYPRWESVRRAAPGRLAAAIKSGGLAQIKSRRIIALLRLLKSQRGSLSLEYLKKMPAEEAYAYLMSLKGVGPKTAACTLLFGAGLPLFPVDTHIYRVSSRLGWVRKKGTPEKFQERFRHAVPGGLVFALHINLIEHGRRTCHPQRPACTACCLNSLCQLWKGRWTR